MQCNLAQELFSDYVSGEIDRAKSVSLENHLQTCSECQLEVDGLRQVWSELDEMPAVSPPANFHTLVMTRLDEELSYQASERAEVRKPTFMETLRSFFQARNLAYTAVALALLLGVQAVQSNRAAMGPLDWAIQLLHPNHPLKTQRVELSPTATGGETITVHLQANALSMSGPTKFNYRLQVVRKDGVAEPALSSAEKTGEFDSLKETSVSLEVPTALSEQGHELKLTLTPAEGGLETNQSLPLTPAP